MRILAAAIALAVVALTLGALPAADKGPDKLTFASKMGDVSFDHAKHVERAKGDCKVCHDKLWPQKKDTPLNYKAGMHKPAEANQASCAFCHHAKGAAFASVGNCNKCHVKAGAKKG